MFIHDWLKITTNCLYFSNAPRRDAEILLSFVLRKSISWIHIFDKEVISHHELSQLAKLVDRRKKGEPIAYITEECEFWSLVLTIRPVTLIPRRDTELLVKYTLDRMTSIQGSLLDLGTGSGAISLALASEYPNWKITGVDNIIDAINLAKFNSTKLNLNNTIFYYSNWFSNLKDNQYDLIVSNPPYIDTNDFHLKQGDLRFEPKNALVAKNQGLADIKFIINNASLWLRHKGWVIIEHGWQQGYLVRAIFLAASFSKVRTYKDYNNNDRVTVGQII